MIEVYRIPIPKDNLLKLPKEERVLLLQLGYMANQVLMFEKLLIFATKIDPKGEAEQYATGVQTQMLVRLAVAAVFEALRTVEKGFVSAKIGKDYQDHLDAKGRDALGYACSLTIRCKAFQTRQNNLAGYLRDDRERIEENGGFCGRP